MANGQKVIVGMSGGVDSSVAAHILVQQGFQVEGLFMKNWDEDDGTEYCSAKEDLADATQVCNKIGIPLHTANFAAEYWDNVFAHFLNEYSVGRTPNPDILCNKEIKFKVFLDYAKVHKADFIATGHYVRRGTKNGKASLFKGLDGNKDQSYFLYAVNQAAFEQSLFPLGQLKKAEVREIADKAGFITSKKKDSTGICFIGERRFNDFLKQYLPAQPGKMMTPEGEFMGEHQGLMFYTLGQRQGLGIGGVKNAGNEPWYSLGKDLQNNTLIVGQGANHPLLFTDNLSASSMHGINGLPNIGSSINCHAKTRYRQPDQPCQVNILSEDECQVNFIKSQRAVTPGQSIVFYQGDQCLGGGIIDQAWKNESNLKHNRQSG